MRNKLKLLLEDQVNIFHLLKVLQLQLNSLQNQLSPWLIVRAILVLQRLPWLRKLQKHQSQEKADSLNKVELVIATKAQQQLLRLQKQGKKTQKDLNLEVNRNLQQAKIIKECKLQKHQKVMEKKDKRDQLLRKERKILLKGKLFIHNNKILIYL